MSQYTTGEIAKLCGVTTRTVQYYDARGILTPSALSEGGRRLYDDEDVKRLKIICFLRDLDLPINAIGQLLGEEDPGSVIALLLDQQAQALREELAQCQDRLARLEELRRGLRAVERMSVEAIGDIANIMENRKKLKKLRWTMVLTGLPLSALQWSGILLWALKGRWQLFAAWAVLVIPFGIWVSKLYHGNVAYICPQCHEVFRPSFRQMFFATHTPTTRKLTCPHCGHRGFCVETWGGESDPA